MLSRTSSFCCSYCRCTLPKSTSGITAVLAHRDFHSTPVDLRNYPKSKSARQHEWDSRSKSLKHSSDLGYSDRPPRNHKYRSYGIESSYNGNPPSRRLPQKTTSQRIGTSYKNWTPEYIRAFLLDDLARWSQSGSVLDRLQSMGIPSRDAKHLLKTFLSQTPNQVGGWFPPSEDERWKIDKAAEDFREDAASASDRLFTCRFMAWALESSEGLDTNIVKTLEAVRKATDYRHPSLWFPRARQNRRKVIMHIGPTNSGKTHNALCALASARNGVYASPLRLLAHEIYTRLNNGEIIPRGADKNADPETFKRACNLVTGEERRIMSDLAGLTSCTIEMITANNRYDVAVIDEIQMLSDTERGGAWTSAVLGLNATELHLCGEERALPLVQQMLQDTGDEIVINRYERLTPLKMADESLNGDLKAIKKGDCVVAFSRERLFALKRMIERETGMRCAIIYGRLPPEVRAEQAALFNDPDSGYDVLVGSDAIGMGLNLKIKRIVFETSKKFNGTEEEVLSASQLKQIAGRAGRFGLHSEDTVGLVTTLNDEDFHVVEKAVTGTFPPDIERATFPHLSIHRHELEQLIYPRTLSAVNDVQYNVALLPPYLAMTGREKNKQITELIDATCADLTLEERMILLMAPLSWREPEMVQAGKSMLETYKNKAFVPMEGSLRGLGFVEALEDVQKLRREEEKELLETDIGNNEEATAIDTTATKTKSSEKDAAYSGLGVVLRKLESLYRVAIVYMWLSMRLPVAFPEHSKASAVKRECEISITWCLQKIRSRNQSGSGRKWLVATDYKSKERERSTREAGSWRKGTKKTHENYSWRKQTHRN